MPTHAIRGVLAAVLVLILPGLGACGPVPLLTAERPAEWAFDRVEDLPERGDLDGTTLAEALVARRSVRAFAATPLSAGQSADLLWAAQGVTASWGGRTAPSAGALYPLEVYLVTAGGIRRYLPDGHRAEVRDDTDARRALADVVGQDAAAQAPALVVITGTPRRLLPKYLMHAERYTLMEAGHAAQNLLLAATALGLGGVPIGAIDEAGVSSVLGLPDGEDPVYVIAVGTPAPSATPPTG